LKEPSGTIYHFLASTANGNLLDYILDRVGNRVTLTYSGKLVTSVTDGFGNAAQLQYDSLGHITSLTDPAGRVTTYTYHNYTVDRGTQVNYSFLETVTESAGTTTFTWMNEGTENSVIFPKAALRLIASLRLVSRPLRTRIAHTSTSPMMLLAV
jgi:YD repeat-containing protein